MRPISFLPYYGVPGILYIPFLAMFFSYVTYSLYLMFSDYNSASPQRKAQVLLIGIGTFGYGTYSLVRSIEVETKQMSHELAKPYLYQAQILSNMDTSIRDINQDDKK